MSGQDIGPRERMIPELDRDTLIYGEHVVRYLFAGQFVRGKRILDVASGAGYGAGILKRAGARSVVGVDYSTDAVRGSAARELESVFAAANAQHLPFANASFDGVVSFETIEHVPDPEGFLREIRRILRPDGLFVVSSPNRGVYPSGNPFHLKEFSYEEFHDVLSSYFTNVTTLSEDNWIVSALLSDQDMTREEGLICGSPGVSKATPRKPNEALYLVALCSDSALPSYEAELVVARASESQGIIEALQVRDAANERIRLELRAIKRAYADSLEENAALRRRVGSITGSTGWKALRATRSFIRRAAPAGTRRARAYRSFLRTLRGPWE